MRILDRLLFVAFLKAYAICLVSLLSLYVVIDLFTNLEDFAQHTSGLMPILNNIGRYYGYKVVQIFDRLCEAIVLLAAAFTVAWVQRNNELLPLLSAGVPTWRVIMPVLVGAASLIGLGAANQELVIPRIADALLADRDDPHGEKTLVVAGAYDSNGIHIEGTEAKRNGLIVRPFYVTVPESLADGLLHISAKEACYVPASPDNPNSGGWLMTGTIPAVLDKLPPSITQLDPGQFFLHTTDVDFDVLTRNRQWFMFASTNRLRELLTRPDARRMAAIAVQFHMRLTRPILGLLLVTLGLSVILRDAHRNVFIGTGLCLGNCALFFAAIFACKHLGDSEYLSPHLAAWAPVLVFGPLTFMSFDAIHT
ncbi:MAG: LptF/LptG family permease [Gemmataceae bacterium]|nr:LptF/LptG family permease [Gemmataceae bacterium]